MSSILLSSESGNPSLDLSKKSFYSNVFLGGCKSPSFSMLNLILLQRQKRPKIKLNTLIESQCITSWSTNQRLFSPMVRWTHHHLFAISGCTFTKACPWQTMSTDWCACVSTNFVALDLLDALWPSRLQCVLSTRSSLQGSTSATVFLLDWQDIRSVASSLSST